MFTFPQLRGRPEFIHEQDTIITLNVMSTGPEYFQINNFTILIFATFYWIWTVEQVSLNFDIIYDTTHQLTVGGFTRST